MGVWRPVDIGVGCPARQAKLDERIDEGAKEGANRPGTTWPSVSLPLAGSRPSSAPQRGNTWGNAPQDGVFPLQQDRSAHVRSVSEMRSSRDGIAASPFPSNTMLLIVPVIPAASFAAAHSEPRRGNRGASDPPLSSRSWPKALIGGSLTPRLSMSSSTAAADRQRVVAFPHDVVRGHPAGGGPFGWRARHNDKLDRPAQSGRRQCQPAPVNSAVRGRAVKTLRVAPPAYPRLAVLTARPRTSRWQLSPALIMTTCRARRVKVEKRAFTW